MASNFLLLTFQPLELTHCLYVEIVQTIGIVINMNPGQPGFTFDLTKAVLLRDKEFPGKAVISQPSQVVQGKPLLKLMLDYKNLSAINIPIDHVITISLDLLCAQLLTGKYCFPAAIEVLG